VIERGEKEFFCRGVILLADAYIAVALGFSAHIHSGGDLDGGDGASGDSPISNPD